MDALIGIGIGAVLTLVGFFANRTLRAVETALKDLTAEVHQQNTRVRDLEEARREHGRRIERLERATPPPCSPSPTPSAT